MAAVTLNNVDKTYPGGVRAVRDVSLEIPDGEFLVLVGPSGCGKSTILRMIAGLEEISRGEIQIGGKRVNELPPQARDIALVFQNYALYPHKTVRGNMEFPLRMAGVSRGERHRRVDRIADQLGLTPLLDKLPKQLSGGQRQRVAMGRAMVREPQVFLLDEPLSNLDARLRVRIRTEIAQLQRELGVTTLYVTHDQVEAMTLGDRVAVLNGGRLQQVGTGAELYHRPANLFVAGFIGSPRMNLFRTTLHRDVDTRFYVDFAGSRLTVPPRIAQAERLSEFVDKALIAGLRPEALRTTERQPGSAEIRGVVAAVEALGHETVLYVDSPLVSRIPEEDQTSSEENSRAHQERLIARINGGNTHPSPGDPIQLTADGETLHLFDTHGQAIR